MLDKLYTPKLQKSLFNKDCVEDIKKWIKQINEDDAIKNRILFINGKNGCGKSATIRVLFKNHNIHDIDPDNIRTIDTLEEICNSISDYKTKNIENFLFDQYVKKPSVKDESSNILLIKNIKHCEKTLGSFLNQLYEKYKKQIPIILCCTENIIRQRFKSIYPTTFIDLKQPTQDDLILLIKRISNDMNLKLSNDIISKIISTSDSNLHQVYRIIEHIIANNKTNESINSSVIIDFDKLKQDHDIDLHEKIKLLFNFNNDFDLNKLYNIAEADSFVITNNIFQNYLQNYLQNYTHSNNNTCNSLEECNIMDNLSYACDGFTEYKSHLIDNSYDNADCIYDVFNILKPLYIMRNIHNNNGNNGNDSNNSNNINSQELILELEQLELNQDEIETEQEMEKNTTNLTHYTGYTHNFITNLNEINMIIIESYNNINKCDGDIVSPIPIYKEISWELLQIIVSNIKNINMVLNIKKRNVTTEYYINLLKTNNMYDTFLFVIDCIWNYVLFETNENIFKIKYKKEDITINLKILKRLLNIYSFTNQSKILKTYTENIIKHELISRILNKYITNLKESNNNLIDNMTYDLNDIWGISQSNSKENYDITF